MNKGDKVYVVWVGRNSEHIETYTLEEIGIDRAILRGKEQGYEPFKRPGELISAPLSFVFPTLDLAKAFYERNNPQIGDYVAVIHYDKLIKGLVVKATPKMVDILLSDEKDIARNKNRMTSRHHKHNVISLIRNH